MDSNLQLRRARVALFRAQNSEVIADDPLSISELRAFGVQGSGSGTTYAVLQLRTKSGLVGYGECRAVSPGSLKTANEILARRPASAYSVFGPLLPDDLRAGVDMAALDILGKATKAPVYRVLGGPTRNKARVITRLAGSSDEELIAALRKQVDAGFRAFLIPIPVPAARNAGSAFVKAAETRLRALREAAPEADFGIEASGRLTPGDAASLATAVERLHPLWFDEPCAVSNLSAVRKISGETVVPLGFGRGISEPGTFQDLLREGFVDLLRPDLLTHGITGIRRLAAMAETYYVAVALQHEGGDISTAAALHLAASIPNFFILQLPESASLPKVQAGYLELPKGPGLGVDVNEQQLEKGRIA